MNHDQRMRKLAIRNILIFLVVMTVWLILNTMRLLDSVDGLSLLTIIFISMAIGAHSYRLADLIKDRK